ncbi:MAG: CoA transferase [Hyphomicrobiales bacterium]|nr:CoA transferase [Hyphomicrobiales bacterium]
MNGTSDPTALPLSGLRVLDFSIMLAGPYCARLLADAGAEVIKIEPPEGDDMRLRTPLREGFSSYFGQLNAGKRSVALDLKCREAIEIVVELARDADIVVENFRPGVMDRLGLGYESLRAINPRLIFCSISGYGQTGPDAQRAAYAMIVHAESGFDRTLMRYAGDRDRPAAGAVFVADVFGGVFAYSAIQTALVHRNRTGQGQNVDVSLMDCMLNLLIYEIQEAQFPAQSARPTYGPVRAGDGDILIAPITPRNFAALCETTGQKDLLNDPRFSRIAQRSANWTELMTIVERWTSGHSVEDCLTALNAAGVPCARYNDPAAALGDEHLNQRELFSRVFDGAGVFLGVNAPWKMSACNIRIKDEVPTIGADTHDVLSRLGMSNEKMQRFAEAGAFGARALGPRAK